MNVTSETIDEGPQRMLVFRPAGVGGRRLPGVVAWPDIFQHTGPHRRLCQRLAGYGYVVATPELYGRFEPRGTVLDFERDRQRALDDAARLEMPALEEDLDAAVNFLREHPAVEAGALAAAGWCLGGHLAFKAAFRPDIRATACFYPTGLHTDSVGAAQGTARTLAEAARIQGRMLLVWGRADPHIPRAGRQRVHRVLAEAGVEAEVRVFEAEHTFMRDEGARYEPVAADQAFADLVRMLGRLEPASNVQR